MSVTQNNVPADHAADTSRRMSVLVWADVLFDGRAPLTRIAYADQEARDGIYSWIYIRELLAIREMVDALYLRTKTQKVQDLLAAFQEVRQGCANNGLLNEDILKVFAPLLIVLSACGEEQIEFCEMGSTLFSTIDKIRLNATLLEKPLENNNIYYTGIEHSMHMQKTAKALYPGHELRFFNDWREWKKDDRCKKHVFLSRFVASYAMHDTDTLIDWLDSFDVFTITDVFNMGEGDFQTWDLGLPMTFFDFPKLVEALLAKGWLISITDIHPDYHAFKKQDCFVARLFGIKKSVMKNSEFQEHLSTHPQVDQFIQNGIVKTGTAQAFKHGLLTQISPQTWDVIRKYKTEYPVWGPSPSALPAGMGQPRKVINPNVNPVLDSPQIVDAINQVLMRK